MVTAPCCEKTGLKKGPWTPKEDQILVNHIRRHGHANWRALPKEAGLQRCGKSCRLRWTNYLRPGIRRGDFTKEEEETIIKLHKMLGNRWSAIAAKLRGRTDNEIKNVWRSHLKWRLKQNSAAPIIRRRSIEVSSLNQKEANGTGLSQPSCSDISPVIPNYNSDDSNNSSSDSADNRSNSENPFEKEVFSAEKCPEIDDQFWSELLSDESSLSLRTVATNLELQLPVSPIYVMEPTYGNTSDGIYFWYNLLNRAEEPLEL